MLERGALPNGGAPLQLMGDPNRRQYTWRKAGSIPARLLDSEVLTSCLSHLGFAEESAFTDEFLLLS